jgi:hypothetical protein
MRGDSFPFVKWEEQGAVLPLRERIESVDMFVDLLGKLHD